ncbi:FliM/FliN family flagellar motor switch protein [Shewanella corallii]|uniref:FliM/FliN family flagellar motor switch protein n=1 Tax=Shewanella corallii TaxID=560080 RepID=A0ABT0NB37_9GAMM|nr:FliM/FliN family flagellar motor switch protein [Shewanella corallii]MCL2915061.1 FliM/FliN family flagellar motor switch protein [Shewanella corallii]
MKTTAKAKVLPSDSQITVRSVDLVQEKLARSRLLLELEQGQQRLCSNINQVLKPFMRQGGAGIQRVSLDPQARSVHACHEHVWFSLSQQRRVLAVWRIDRCTLEQLASSNYGGQSGHLFSPLRSPTQSEFRLGLKLLKAALATMPLPPLDFDNLQLELMSAGLPLETAACWQLTFADDYPVAPMLFAMTDHLLNLLTGPATSHQVVDDLAARLEQRLMQIPVQMKLEVGRQHLPVDSLSQLSVGDVLPLTLHRRCPVSLGQRPLFYASVHAHEGQLVARLNQDAYQEEDVARV